MVIGVSLGPAGDRAVPAPPEGFGVACGNLAGCMFSFTAFLLPQAFPSLRRQGTHCELLFFYLENTINKSTVVNCSSFRIGPNLLLCPRGDEARGEGGRQGLRRMLMRMLIGFFRCPYLGAPSL